MVRIVYSNRAEKDAKKLSRSGAGLQRKAEEIIAILQENPFLDDPPYKLLVGNLYGFYSRRINHQHRLVYRVNKEEEVVKVYSMWGHYDD
ncbi:MAG: Txe/YoeB family addiction module toxin [Gammaproteobacteria bacterium]|nr:Txe/YoeB family addiction module toxin [Gammaproteobacteria bacterium]MDD9871524.1 Txe/YoeB family addiction module toxin [Gammaproteobacteria bacterium]